MKCWAQTVLGITLAFSVAACSGDRATTDQDRPAARDQGGATGTTGANADRDFIQDQLEDGHAEIELAKLASERATHPQVKEFARMMVKDHQSAAEELQESARTGNVQVEPPAELDRDHKDAQEDLSKLSGREFDRKYMDMMVDEHQEAVNELERHQDSNNTQVRQWVTKTLPTVRQHLERARELQQTLERAGDTK